VTHPDKILLLVEECENLQSASTHLRFSMERTRELIQRVRDEISSEELERLESLASRFARLTAVQPPGRYGALQMEGARVAG